MQNLNHALIVIQLLRLTQKKLLLTLLNKIIDLDQVLDEPICTVTIYLIWCLIYEF